MNDNLKATGVFKLDVFDGGVMRESIVENNLVVTLGKQNIARLLGGHASGKKVEKIAVGTSNATPLVDNTTLTGIFSKAILSVAYPATNSVQYNFEIENGEANGMTISEFGLLNTDNVLFARKVRGTDIVKTSAIRLVGSWTITIN